MADTVYIAHRRDDTGEEQTIKTHSEQTAAMAAGFAIEPIKPVAYAAGTRHDDGKYQPSFQARMRDPRIRAPHAFCGAQEVRERYGLKCAGLMMAYVVAGHHAGLPDYGFKSDIADDPTLCGCLQRTAEDYSACRDELPSPRGS